MRRLLLSPSDSPERLIAASSNNLDNLELIGH